MTVQTVPARLHASHLWEKTVAVTTNVEFELCRGLTAQTAGTATLTYADDTTDTVYLVQGFNPYICKKVVLVTAANVSAGY